jgi:dienelactone hydrolase
MLLGMAEVVVFHHALGLTDPVRRFADALRHAGHTVHTPDLYDGRRFATIEDGMAHSEELGGPMAIVDRARAAVESLPSEVVYVGFSLGVLAAQSLAQTRPGARGAVLCYATPPCRSASGATTGRRRGQKACDCSCTPWRATRTSRSRRGWPQPCPERSCWSIPAPSTISPSTTTRRPRC